MLNDWFHEYGITIELFNTFWSNFRTKAGTQYNGHIGPDALDLGLRFFIAPNIEQGNRVDARVGVSEICFETT
jgi:hypothetical protein